MARIHSRSAASRAALFVACLVASFATAGVGAAASVRAASFYLGLQRPAWAPPAGVFGPVWTVLFTLMAVAAWRVACRPASRQRRAALALFGVQLVANALWSWLFFGWHLGAAASVEVVVLLGLIAATVRAFWRVDRVAAWLMGPYLAWVAFATALTVVVWRMNPGALG